MDYYLSLQPDDLFNNKIELDESYFESVCKGKREQV